MINLEKRISDLIETKDKVIIAIDGPSGSGKSTIAKGLREKYDGNLFHMDDFFLRPEQRTSIRLNETGGNVDYERFYEDVLKNIEKGFPFAYRPYNCSLRQLVDERVVSYKKINIVEGVYSMHPMLLPFYNIKVFITASKEVRINRIRKRNGEEMLQRFINEWIPMEDKYFDHYGIKDLSDFTICGVSLKEI